MASFVGQECPVCHQKFGDSEQIVVCPECGTPHHRACYFKEGRCANEARHADGYVWEPEELPGQEQPGAQAPQDSPAAGGDPSQNYQIPCPHCGAANPQGASFCISCGKPMSSQQESAFQGVGFGGFQFDQQAIRYGGVSPTDTIDGIPVADMAEFIGPSSGYYLQAFKRMDISGKKLSFSWSGFFISPLYTLFRKIWPLAVLCLLFTTVMNLPTLISLFESGGNLDTMMNMLNSDRFLTFSYISTLLMMVYRVVFGLFSNYFYRRSVVSKMRKIQEKGLPREETLALYRKKGGVSRAAILILLGIYLAASFLMVLALDI